MPDFGQDTSTVLWCCARSPIRTARELEALSVADEQQNYVSNVTDSLAEAAEYPDACPWYRAVYVNDVPVGFVMVSDNIPPERTEYVGPYFLWKLLIDARFQGRGYGRQVLDLVVDFVSTRPNAKSLLTSFVPGDDSPRGFYLEVRLPRDRRDSRRRASARAAALECACDAVGRVLVRGGAGGS